LIYNKSLNIFAIVTACCTFFLLIAGGFVTSTNSGLAVPDWPDTYGENMFLFPLEKMVGGIFFEHGHRLLASFVGFLTVILCIWIWKKESRPWMKKLGFLALLAVIVQGIFGGITVLFYLPQFVSATHATLAQTFFCIVVSIALFTSKEWSTENTSILQHSNTPTLQSLTKYTTFAIYVQLILGAMLRHADHVMSFFLLLHIIGAIVSVYFVIHTHQFIKKHISDNTILRFSGILYRLAIIQIFLGVASLFLKLGSYDAINTDWAMVLITVLHLATGALMLATSLITSLNARKSLQTATETNAHYSILPQQ